jgi:hypothetical protein
MPITAKLHNSPNGRNANSSGKPTVATSSSDGWLSVENSRLHREVARLRRELEAYTSEEGQAALMEVQVENARLAQEVRRLQQQNSKLRGKIASSSREAGVQAHLPILSQAVGFATGTPEARDVASSHEGEDSPEMEPVVPKAVQEILRVPQVPRPTAKVSAATETTWLQYGGDLIEPLVRSGAVAFVDARWIIEAAEAQVHAVAQAEAAKHAAEAEEAKRAVTKAAKRDQRKGEESKGEETLQIGALPPRQYMPPEAFLSINELKSAGCPHGGLPLLIVSCMWLSPWHPDPTGYFLQQLASFLRAMMPGSGQRYGVFWDYISIEQFLDTQSWAGKRDADAEAAYKQACDGMGRLYAHEYTTVLQFTQPPGQYPDGTWSRMLSTSANKASYNGRGWCVVEEAFARWTKDPSRCLDLGKLPICAGARQMETMGILVVPEKGSRSEAPLEHGKATAVTLESDPTLDRKALFELCSQLDEPRMPPLAPPKMKAKIDVLSYSTKEDRPTVQTLYAAAYVEHFGRVVKLDYDGLEWGDEEILVLIEAFATGHLHSVESLWLRNNLIGRDGMRALADAVKTNVLPGCCVAIILDGNPGNPAVVTAALEARSWHPPPRAGKDVTTPLSRKTAGGGLARSGSNGRATGGGSSASPGGGSLVATSPGGPAERGAALMDGAALDRLQGQGGGRSAIKPGLPRATRDPADNGPPTPPRRASPRQRTPERGGALANYYEGGWSSVRQPGTQEAAN